MNDNAQTNQPLAAVETPAVSEVVPRRSSVQELKQILASGEHGQIIGIREDRRIEFKSQLNLTQKDSKHKLAKAVASLANTAGGLVLVGVRTEQDIQSHRDYAVELQFGTSFDCGAYHQILSKLLYPRVEIELDVYGEGERLLLAVSVNLATSLRPVLVTDTLSEKLTGETIFGYYERNEGGTGNMKCAEIHALLQAGIKLGAVGELGSQLDLIHTRLEAIGNKLGIAIDKEVEK